MVAGYFKGTDSVLKAMSHCATHLQWDIRFVTWLNSIQRLRRGSSECNSQFVQPSASPLRLPEEYCGRNRKSKSRQQVFLYQYWVLESGIIIIIFKTQCITIMLNQIKIRMSTLFNIREAHYKTITWLLRVTSHLSALLAVSSLK